MDSLNYSMYMYIAHLRNVSNADRPSKFAHPTLA